MRTEAEIRHQVETRLRRWGLLALNAILWVGAAKLIYSYRFGNRLDFIAPIMFGWLALIGLHTLRTIYVEAREYFVHRAIEHERQFYLLQDADEKPKRLELTEDGELVDFPLMDDEVRYDRRS